MRFELDEKQVAKFDSWSKSLPRDCGGAIGGRFLFKFTPTSIGDICKVVDQATKQELDLTDYEAFDGLKRRRNSRTHESGRCDDETWSEHEIR